MVELGPHLATERARVETLHLPVRAPGIYPDIRTLRSFGGRRDPCGRYLLLPARRAISGNPSSN